MHNSQKSYTHLSCFDLDHTLLCCNSSFHFGKFLYKKKVFSFSTMTYLAGCYALHKMNMLSLEKMQMHIFTKLFKGKQFDLFDSLAEEFVESHFDKIIYKPVVELLEEARNQNHYTAIISSSPNFLVEKFARKFNVTASFGSSYEVNTNNSFRSISEIIKGSHKANCLQRIATNLRISKHNISAYSDSILDLEFLEAAGQPFAVRPDKKLRIISHKNDWQIL